MGNYHNKESEHREEHGTMWGKDRKKRKKKKDQLHEISTFRNCYTWRLSPHQIWGLKFLLGTLIQDDCIWVQAGDHLQKVFHPTVTKHKSIYNNWCERSRHMLVTSSILEVGEITASKGLISVRGKCNFLS